MGGIIMGCCNTAKDNHGAVVTSCFSVRWRVWLLLIMPVLLVMLSSCGGSSGGNAGGNDGNQAVVSYDISTSAGQGGAISPVGATVESGKTAAFSILAQTGYSIDTVSGCGGALSGIIYTTGPITADCTVTASFAINSYTVNATAGAGGAISPGSVNVDFGGTASFTVTPDAGFSIAGVTGCNGMLSGNTYTTGAVSGNCTVSASFVETPPVSGVFPVNGAADAPRIGAITASFSKPMMASTIGASSFLLVDSASGAAVSGAVSYDAVANVAAFVPDAPLSALGAYTATLTTAVTGQDGLPLSADYNWSFTTVGPGWGTAVRIESGEGIASDAQIAFDGNGNAVAVWRRGTSSFVGASGIDDIWSSYFDGGKWSPPSMISNGLQTGSEPQVAMNSAGQAVAVWRQEDGAGGFDIWVNRFDGAVWGVAETIDNTSMGAQMPQVAIDGNGNALVVWVQEGVGVFGLLGYNDIYVSRFDGMAWGAPEALDTINEIANLPQVAFDSDGNAVVVWSQYSGSGGTDNIYANRFDAATLSWQGASLIEFDDTGRATDPQIAFDGSGNALSVWRQSESNDFGSRTHIQANRFDGAGLSWGAPVLIENDNTSSALVPSLAMNSSGNAMAVWAFLNSATGNTLYASRFDGVSWDTPLKISNLGNVFDQPQVAVDASGNAVAVWIDNGAVLTSRFDGVAWSSVETISNASGNASRAQVGFDSSGNPVAIWEQNRAGGGSDIWVSHFLN